MVEYQLVSTISEEISGEKVDTQDVLASHSMISSVMEYHELTRYSRKEIFSILMSRQL